MVAETAPYQTNETPDLVPLKPEWMEERPSTAQNYNINDIYWKRSSNERTCAGWIIVGPSAEMGHDGRPITRQAEKWLRKGRIPLIEFSRTDRWSEKRRAFETIETSKDRLGSEWRFWWLFKNKGAHLFPIEQIVAHKWHIKPPYGLPLSVFPQLQEYEVPEPRWCQMCPGDRQPFNSDGQLVKHAMLMHGMSGPDANAMLLHARQRPLAADDVVIREKPKAPAAERSGTAATPPKRLKVEVDPPRPKAKKVVIRRALCECGQVFSSGIEKHNHKRKGECPGKPTPEGETSGVHTEQDSVAPTIEETNDNA